MFTHEASYTIEYWSLAFCTGYLESEQERLRSFCALQYQAILRKAAPEQIHSALFVCLRDVKVAERSPAFFLDFVVGFHLVFNIALRGLFFTTHTIRFIYTYTGTFLLHELELTTVRFAFVNAIIVVCFGPEHPVLLLCCSKVVFRPPRYPRGSLRHDMAGRRFSILPRLIKI